jgi:WD40 repeat protein
MLATAGHDHSVYLWDVATGNQHLHLKDDTTSPVLSVTFSKDGKFFAWSEHNATLVVWQFHESSWNKLYQLQGHTSQVHGIAFSPDGRVLASGGDDGTLRQWNMINGLELWQQHMETAIHSLCFSPDGQLLAIGNADSSVRLLELASGNEVRRLMGHTAGVRTVAFSPDGRMLASGGDDCLVLIWGLGVSPETWYLLEQTWDSSQDEQEIACREQQHQQPDIARHQQHKQEMVEEIRRDHQRLMDERNKWQRKVWRVMGCCEVCGEPLRLWDRMFAQTYCKHHRKGS